MPDLPFDFKPSFLFRLFTDGVNRLSISPDDLNFCGKNKKKSKVPFAELTHLPAAHSWLFFHTLEFNTSQGLFKLRGLSKKQALSAKKQIDTFWYLSRLGQVQTWLKEIREELHKPYYLRSSQWLVLQQRIETDKAWLPALPPAGLLEANIEQLFFDVSEILTNPLKFLKASREQHINQQLQRYGSLFDTVESSPLTDKQRLACIVDDNNNLVLAGAGTGKTSTVIGRVAYLVQSGLADPSEILLLAFANKAQQEMRERLQSRLGIDGVSVNTFHSLGLQILAAVEHGKPSISKYAEDASLKTYFVEQTFQKLQQDEVYRQQLLLYFEKWLFPEENPFEFQSYGDYINYMNDNEIRTLKNEKVRSFAECQIANYLFKNGIEYQYEAKYKIDTRTPEFRAYQPDFYLPEYDIYIEHFGIDRQSNTAPYVDREKYLQAMRWKRALHAEQHTQLIETFHYEQQEQILLTELEKKLKKVGVVFEPLPADSVLETLREFGAITAFSRLLSDLLSQYKNAHLTDEELAKKIIQAKKPDQMKAAMALLKPIVEAYQQALVSEGAIDFDDMIGLAYNYVRDGLYQSRWKYILIDEYQDISLPRAKLVKALRDQRPDASLFCVGDDWQSIYRFTGSDIHLTSEFQTFFGYTQITKLDKTFRFNSSINEIASRFVLKNPIQLKKKMTSHRQVENRAVSLMRTNKQTPQAVDEILVSLAREAKPSSSVYFLARFRELLPNLECRKTIEQKYRANFEFRYDTIHASKGKEADYVVLLGLTQGKYGLPSGIVTHPLINALQPETEAFPDAEERRLFYVALTRAKHKVVIVTNMLKASEFIKELMEDGYPLALDEFECTLEQRNAQALPCPTCKTGTLLLRDSVRGKFMGCSNYPLCKHIRHACPNCYSEMSEANGSRTCVNIHCRTRIQICPQCGGDLILRKGQYGQFYGCSNYRGVEKPSCGYTLKANH